MTEGEDLHHLSMKIEWKIKNFLNLTQEVDKVLQSPHFTFCNARWCIIFYPNGKREKRDMISLYLMKEHSSSPFQVTFRFGIKSPVCSIVESRSITNEFEKNGSGWGIRLLKIDEFKSLKDIVDEEGTLRIYCNMSTDREPLEQTSLSENNEVMKLPASIEQKEDVINIFRRKDLTLPEDYKWLLQTKGDTTVRVGEKQFLVHKLVLALHSSVFRDMFKKDMVEKNHGVINIEDCEPGPFEDFLLILYGRQFDIVGPSNVLKLFLIADRYNVVPLKTKCFEIITETFSEESICDAVCLAMFNAEDEELLSKVAEYFMMHMETILHSAKWYTLLREYPTAANDLLIAVAKKIETKVVPMF